MSVPAKHYLDDLRALRGAPKVSYPYGGTTHPRIERVYSVPKGRVDDIPATLADYAGSVLVALEELKRDHTEVEVYLLYETLPGPWLPFTRYDLLLGPIQGRRRAVVADAATQLASLTATAQTTYEARDGSAVVSWQIEETNSDGTGSAGNPAYPITVENFYDEERGAVERSTQIVADIASNGSLTIAVTTATLIRYEPYNQFLRKKIIEFWEVPGPLRFQAPQYDTERGQITSTKQLVDAAGKVGVRIATKETSYRPSSYGAALVMEIIEDWADNMPDRPAREWNDERGPVAQTIEQVPAAGQVASLTESGGTVTEISYKPVDEYQVTKITETWTVPAQTFTEDDFDAQRGAIQRTTQIIAFASVTATLAVSGGNLATLTTYKPLNQILLRKTIETWAVPGPLLRDKERYDENLGFITSTRQLVENTGQTQSESGTGRTKYDASPYGTALLWEPIESWTLPGPEQVANSYDKERGAVQTTTQLIAFASVTGSLTESGGVITEISYKPFNEYILQKITEVGSGTYPTFTEDVYDNERGAVQRTSQLVTASAVSGSIVVSGGAVTETSYQPYNEFLLKQVIETWSLPGPALIRYDTDDETQTAVTITTQLIAKPADYAELGNTAGTQVDYIPLNDYFGKKVTSSIGAAPTGRTETSWREFHFPALVVAPAVSSSHEALDGTVRVLIDWQHRSARRLPTLHQSVVTYGTEAGLTLPALEWDPQLQDLDRNGLFLNPPRMIGVLCNAISLPFNTSSSNPKWGYLAETLSFAASSPTTAQYLADYLGNYKIVAAAKAPWKYNLWRMVVTKVKMR